MVVEKDASALAATIASSTTRCPGLFNAAHHLPLCFIPDGVEHPQSAVRSLTDPSIVTLLFLLLTLAAGHGTIPQRHHGVHVQSQKISRTTVVRLRRGSHPKLGSL